MDKKKLVYEGPRPLQRKISLPQKAPLLSRETRSKEEMNLPETPNKVSDILNDFDTFVTDCKNEEKQKSVTF